MQFPAESTALHRETTMLSSIRRLSVLAVCLISATSLCAFARTDEEDARLHVERAQTTLSHFMRDSKMTWVHNNFSRAKAVIIVPEIVKFAVIFGGSGGRAVVMARNPNTNKWAGPAFYTISSASVGLQLGLQASEMLILVMTDKGLNSLMATSTKLGGDASVAAGPVGVGAAADVTADMVSFIRSEGLYGGVNLTGTVIGVNNDWNAAYYYPKITPLDIFVRFDLNNPQAADLTDAVAKAGNE
jgi:SH3 domain-containing YSC84-like protein 1